MSVNKTKITDDYFEKFIELSLRNPVAMAMGARRLLQAHGGAEDFSCLLTEWEEQDLRTVFPSITPKQWAEIHAAMARRSATRDSARTLAGMHRVWSTLAEQEKLHKACGGNVARITGLFEKIFGFDFTSEHQQSMLALVAKYWTPEEKSRIFRFLDAEMQRKVLLKIIRMQRLSEEVVLTALVSWSEAANAKQEKDGDADPVLPRTVVPPRFRHGPSAAVSESFYQQVQSEQLKVESALAAAKSRIEEVLSSDHEKAILKFLEAESPDQVAALRGPTGTA